VRKLAFFGGRGDPLKKRILTAVCRFARSTLLLSDGRGFSAIPTTSASDVACIFRMTSKLNPDRDRARAEFPGDLC
jgi:hypothetical protein